MVDRAVLVDALLAEVAVVGGLDPVIFNEAGIAGLDGEAARDFPAVAGQAAEHAHGTAQGVVPEGVREGDVNRGALVVLLQDQVEHARDRIRAVDRGGAVLEVFDALDRRGRDAVEVEHGLRRAAGAIGQRVGDGAAAVDQRQHAVRSKAARIDGRGPRDERARGELGDARRVVVGQALHELPEGRVAFVLDRRGGEGDDRRDRLVVEALHAGAGHLVGLELLGRAGSGGAARGGAGSLGEGPGAEGKRREDGADGGGGGRVVWHSGAGVGPSAAADGPDGKENALGGAGPKKRRRPGGRGGVGGRAVRGR